MGNGTLARPSPELPVLLGEAEIHQRVAELAVRIAEEHPAGEPLVVLGVMKGAVVFLADLIRRLPMPLEIELVAARSYRGRDRRDEIELLDDVGQLDLSRRHVLLVDCVLDSGSTLAAVRRAVAERGPASVKGCVLLRKDVPRVAGAEAEYVGFDVPDLFVVGYGLDHANRWRHLPYVAALPPEDDEEGGD
jgi:hypoxanthine phosphoribosyltransferase